jgi:hypothetical protein
MDEKVRKEIEDAVASIFSEKEEVDSRQRTEDALTASATTIEELTTTLETKNSEVDAMEVSVSETDEKISNLESELEAAKTEIETTNESLAEATKQVDDMIKDKAADERMADLAGSGVARADKDAQREKIRDMSEEDFASYKEELVSIREAVLEELKEVKQTASEEEADEEVAEKEAGKEESEEGSEEEAEEEASEEEGEVETPAAEIDSGKALAAAMNMEIFPSDDLIKKYGDLGNAMAAALTNKDEV